MKWNLSRSKHKDLFDKYLRKLMFYVPFIGEKMVDKYDTVDWFNRFIKFGVSTTLIFWLVKGPLIWMFNSFIPNIGFIPDYLFSTFIVGLILTIIGFVINEEWIWKQE
jgi:putative flippase GtrA